MENGKIMEELNGFLFSGVDIVTDVQCMQGM